MKKYSVAVVGATGLVGSTFLKVLKEYEFPIGELTLFASSKSAGKEIEYNGKNYVVKELKGKFPLFGIGLGNLLIGSAYGAKSDKLKFGHHGGNHPVMNLETNKVLTVSQGEDYTLNEESLKSTELEITHRDILDKTVAGVENKKDKVFGVQFNPEGAPGAVNDALFDKFIDLMKEGK